VIAIRYLIVNADDFGYGRGINRGIAEAFDRGIVTATTLTVNGRAVDDAVAIARERPSLSVGLHVNFTDEAQRLVEFDDPLTCRSELRRQFDLFVEKVGRLPTHLDSHQHVHRDRRRRPFFRELAREHGIPLRDHSPVVFKGGFYAQWQYGVTDPSKVSYEALTHILASELPPGFYELAVHPGYFDSDLEMVYHKDRELELRTLCDPRLRGFLDQQQIKLIGFADLPTALIKVGNGR
jgi:chitin disaccharide deacetylase